MSDLVPQLRELACISGHAELGAAADLIERQRVALRVAREYIEEDPPAEHGSQWHEDVLAAIDAALKEQK